MKRFLLIFACLIALAIAWHVVTGESPDEDAFELVISAAAAIALIIFAIASPYKPYEGRKYIIHQTNEFPRDCPRCGASLGLLPEGDNQCSACDANLFVQY